MKLRTIFAAIALTIGAALPALADKVGTALVDGRVVDLFADGTWQYRAGSDANCTPLAAQLSFCGDAGVWRKTVAPTDEILSQYRYDDRLYAQFVFEEIGADAGMNLAFMREAVIGNAAAGAGVTPQDIVVIGIEPVELDGQSGETVIYKVDLSGVTLIMMNSIIVSRDFTLQAMTYEVSSDLSNRHPGLHNTFLELTEISE